MPTPKLLLASSSPYRRELLSRLGWPFDCASPDIDETALPGEDARTLAVRLACDKARALANDYPEHLIIGSDQVATLPDGTLLGKPGNFTRAKQQLSQCNGHSVHFETGLALLDSRSGTLTSCCETYEVHFRQLSDQEITHYLQREQPYDCAGSFRMEGLGITLFSRMAGRDPNTLIGLPLMALIDLLSQFGIRPLEQGPE
ncbi:Maf family protein [Marinobacter oulmenensis]|uniref:7-methyl-GTP pyrophosphatase n=1 Tax=Marinobacter oulmenensis TaxID=643747 RepID=A0A840UFW0_9GAMM|nr:Maf family protein [Marinobacter oulmenensis]MBB5322370.1 MAF protein [Marinobacter oulmenensis]